MSFAISGLLSQYRKGYSRDIRFYKQKSGIVKLIGHAIVTTWPQTKSWNNLTCLMWNNNCIMIIHQHKHIACDLRKGTPNYTQNEMKCGQRWRRQMFLYLLLVAVVRQSFSFLVFQFSPFAWMWYLGRVHSFIGKGLWDSHRSCQSWLSQCHTCPHPSGRMTYGKFPSINRIMRSFFLICVQCVAICCGITIGEAT